jgi:hypothetical protein
MFFWGDKTEGNEFKYAMKGNQICVGSCEAESELHGTATVFRRFPSGVVKSVCKKLI